MKMASKLLVFVSILSLTVFAQNQDWSCETVNGTPCTGNMVMVRGVNERDPFLNGSVKATCSNTGKQEANTFLSSSTSLNNENITMKAGCIDESTPCIKDFEVCIQDPNVSAITLKCSYLRNFNQTTNTKCGENGAKKKTHWLRSGFGTTKIDYSNEQIYIAKNITVTESARK